MYCVSRAESRRFLPVSGSFARVGECGLQHEPDARAANTLLRGQNAARTAMKGVNSVRVRDRLSAQDTQDTFPHTCEEKVNNIVKEQNCLCVIASLLVIGRMEKLLTFPL